MKFCDVFDSYIADEFKFDAEANRAIAQFKGNIPGRVLQMEFDGSKSNKQGIKDGDKVYKLGLDLASSTVFIEFLENCNQGQPTMAIYVDRAKKRVTVSGWQVAKKFIIRFALENGVVRKTVNMG